jgi:Rrf2 family protein
MNVSTKSEYGLRALIYLAGKADGRPVSAREISEQWSVPVKYLEQILKTLRQAGLVESSAGVNGGYRLARPATEITAGEAIRALDGRIAPMGCVSEYDYEPCDFEPTCGLRSLWARTRAAVLSVVDTTTVADLCAPPVPARAKLVRR